MNMKKILSIFNISQYKFLQSEDSQFENYFMNCLYDGKWSNMQIMIDNGFRPNSKNNHKMQELLLQLIYSEHALFRDKEYFFSMINNIKNEFTNKNEFTTRNFLTLMIKNNFLDIDFIFKTQEVDLYVKAKSDEKQSLFKRLKEDHKDSVRYSEIFNDYRRKYKDSLEEGKKQCRNFSMSARLFNDKSDSSLFEGSLEIYENPKKNEETTKINEGTLKSFCSDIFDVPLDDLCFDYSEVKDLKNQKLLCDRYSKNYHLLDILSSNEGVVKLMLLLLPEYLIKKAVEQQKITPEKIMERSLIYETKIQYVAISVLKLYPEVINNLSNVNIKKSVRLLQNILKVYQNDFFNDSEEFKKSHITNSFNNYIKNVESKISSDNLLDDEILQRYVLKNKKTMEIELDYVNLAKSNNIANPIVKLLEQCQVEFNSFNKKQMSVIHKEKLDTIDKNIFKSVNSYLDYVELSNKNAENNIKTDADNNLKETIILCHQSIVGVREEIFKEMVEELEKDKVKARARNSY